MLRLIIAIIILVAIGWYLTHDSAPRPDVVKEQREDLEQARETAAFAEKAGQEAAAQTDAIRDAALGKPAQGEGEEDEAAP